MGHLPTLFGLLFILRFSYIQAHNKNCLINNQEYKCGEQLYSQNCVKFDCHCDGRWLANTRYNPFCEECSVRNDPHFTTFDGARYDWHGDCTYVLAEEEGGVSYVYGKFTKCGIASCVDDVIFKPRVGPIIKIKNKNREVVIDGYTQHITDNGRVMQVLRGPVREYPVLAFYMGDANKPLAYKCLHIIAVDNQDFLVLVCRSSIKVFSARKKNTGKDIAGMCGSPDQGNANTDLKLRNGTIVANPGGCCFDHIVDSAFAESWQVTSAPCFYKAGSQSKSAKKSEAKLCKASDAEKAKYYRVCRNLIGKEKSISEEKKKEFIDNCAFDQCIVTQGGESQETINDWLNQYTEFIEQEVFEQEHQDDISEEDYDYMDYLNDYYNDLETENPGETSTSAPELTCPISRVIEVGNKQYAFFNCPKSYTMAHEFCKLYGWELATPNNYFAEFNKRMPGSGEYWLDVQATLVGDGLLTWFWQTSPKNLTKPVQWNPRFYNTHTADRGTNCASLWQNQGLMPRDCQDNAFYACESFHFLNAQHNELTQDFITGGHATNPMEWH